MSNDVEAVSRPEATCSATNRISGGARMVCLSLLGAACATPPAALGPEAALGATPPSAVAANATGSTEPAAPRDLLAAEVALTALATETDPSGSFAAFPPDLVAARAAVLGGEYGVAARRYVAVLDRDAGEQLALLGLARRRRRGAR